MLLISLPKLFVKQLACLGHLVSVDGSIVRHLGNVIFLALGMQLVQILHFSEVLLCLARVGRAGSLEVILQRLDLAVEAGRARLVLRLLGG